MDDGASRAAMENATQSQEFNADMWVTAIHDSLQTVARETLGVEEADITKSGTHPADAKSIRGPISRSSRVSFPPSSG